MGSNAAINPFQERQRGLTGSVIVGQGQSGTGKTDELTECWLNAGIMAGSLCVALAPTNDVAANVKSYLLGYIRRVDAKRRNGVFSPCNVTELDFIRDRVLVYQSPQECFDVIERLGMQGGNGRPQFSFLVDEGAHSRKDSSLMADIGPLMRNLCGICYITMHRGMAVPPQIRAVTRARLLWRSSDGTGDEELEREIASIPGFEYSPVMGATPVAEQWYRGIRYTPDGPVSFQYNPNIARRPDYMLLPALPTTVRPRVMRSASSQ